MWYNLICNGRASSKDFLFMTNVNKLSDLKFAVLKLDDNASYYDSFVISNDVEGHIELFVNCETGECALTCMAARESWDSEEYKIPWDELNAFLDIYRTFRDGREGRVAHKFQKREYNHEEVDSYEKIYGIGYTTDCKFVGDWIKTFGLEALTCTKYDTAAIREVNKYYYFFVLAGWIDDKILSQLLKEYEEFYECDRIKKRWNNNV